ncbi:MULTISPECIES: HAD-IA family hydrolase [unclassified Acinetobacter]|uniref:HAD family hydrolase n=1 Tax=unclassified Acinetobacter TaxID=196816 RepID=UPI002934A295|nr:MULTISPECIES: HAD-IA family hydrolase [unclassified Acinetobacter]WOE30554.1 HAD-IA family hydrolase [Acinetobacter sp. SAAs470]WOE38746.1 HAD-IA family hydrolase [Acinetobacter sp. SAAs474]
MQKNIKLVVFDWDGTLFDSVGQIVASLKYAAAEFQQPLTDQAAKSIIGLGLPEVAQILFPTVPDLHQQILECYADHYVAHSKNDAWFAGVAEMLIDLKQQGLKLAVATGKSRKGLDRVLAQTQSVHLFDITRAASETRSKPHPQMLSEILSQTDVLAEQAIMVGDTTYDLEMAQNIAMPRIAVSYGVHSTDILTQYQPLCVVDNIKMLHQALNHQVRLSTAV